MFFKRLNKQRRNYMLGELKAILPAKAPLVSFAESLSMKNHATAKRDASLR